GGHGPDVFAVDVNLQRNHSATGECIAPGELPVLPNGLERHDRLGISPLNEREQRAVDDVLAVDLITINQLRQEAKLLGAPAFTDQAALEAPAQTSHLNQTLRGRVRR